MFFKQGCSVLEQNLLARSGTSFCSVFSLFSQPFSFELSFTTHHKLIPFFVIELPRTVPRGKEGGHLIPTPSVIVSELCFFSQNHWPVNNLEVLCKGQTIIFKHKPFGVFAFKYVKIQHHLNCFSKHTTFIQTQI